MLKRAVKVILLAIFIIISSLSSYSAVLINEILANGIREPDSEWVELLNNGSLEVNLTNFNISETASKNFTLNVTIPANSFIVLVENFTLFNSTFPSANQSGIKIMEYGEVTPNFELSNSGGTVVLYNSSGNKIDSIDYVQSTAQENISIGRYPDGSSSTFNISTLTPGAKNDNQLPMLNKWANPSRNNTNISGLTNIIVNITDDTTPVNSSVINLNGTNFSMTKNGDLWNFLWNTSKNSQKLYNITIFFNDSYGKFNSDKLLNIFVNNSPRIDSFSPPSLAQTIAENSTLSFNVNASDPDDAVSFSWYIDNVLNSTAQNNFSYKPGFNANGTHTINATVKDSANQASIKWAVAVTNANRAPALDAISNKTFTKNINSSFNVTANDLDDDSLAFSSNRSGIIVSKINNSLATVSWKPTNLDLGSNAINFTVSDGLLIDSKIITITVNAQGNAAPNITTSAKTIAIVNEQYSYDIGANDLDNDTLSFSLKANASGISIDSSTGLITFKPAQTGVFSVNASVSDLIGITNQSFLLSAIFGTRLKITDVDVKVDSRKSSNIANNTKIGREADPGSEVEFKIKVKNDFTDSEDIDIEDIGVKVTIEEIDDDDDLEEESKEFDLSAEDDKTVTLKFNLPLNIDDGAFDVLIEADGNDENGNEQGQFFKIELEVEKEKHDLRFLSFELSPITIGCNKRINADSKIINVGTDDEENAVLEIQSDLGILIGEKNISIDAGTDDNTYSKSISFKIDDGASSGTYQITANIYTGDSKLQDAKTKEMKVEGCALKEKTEQEVVLTSGQSVSDKTQAIKEQIQTPTIKISFMEDDKMLLLVFSTLVFTSFFVFTAIILYTRL